jgi:NAD-dependent DNA ligase
MSYARIYAGYRNRLVQGCGSLMGIATGLIADRHLNDREIHWLHEWLSANADMSAAWPGDVIYQRVKSVLEDGVVSDAERLHLIETLDKICGGDFAAEETGKEERGRVNQLAFDENATIRFAGASFCVTGDFVYGPRQRVLETIVDRGGEVQKGVTKRLDYLVVGLRGSDEWKHGSFGTKIEKAIEYKRAGAKLYIIPENTWTAALR